MKNLLYGEIIQKEGHRYIDYGGDFLFPYDGPQQDGSISLPLDVPNQAWETFNDTVKEVRKRWSWFRERMEEPYFLLKLAGEDASEQRRLPKQDFSDLLLEYPGYNASFILKNKALPGDMLSALYEGGSIPARIVDGFDLGRHNPRNPIPVYAVFLEDKPVPEVYETVKMYVDHWSEKDVHISVQGYAGWIPGYYFEDFEDKLKTGFFYQGKEIWVRRSKISGDQGFLFAPTLERRYQAGYDTSQIRVSPGMILTEDEVSISYVDWDKQRLMVYYEGFDIPVDSDTIPFWNYRKINFYRYMDGAPVSVKVLQWGAVAEDCLVELLSKDIEYPFSLNECLEGVLEYNRFKTIRHNRQYVFDLQVGTFSGSLIPYREWLQKNTIRVRVNVESISEFGDPVLGLSSLMDRYAAGIPEKQVFQAQVLGRHRQNILWRLGYLLGSNLASQEIMEKYPEGSFIPVIKDSRGFVLDIPKVMTEESVWINRKVPAGEVIPCTILSQTLEGVSVELNTCPGIKGVIPWKYVDSCSHLYCNHSRYKPGSIIDAVFVKDDEKRRLIMLSARSIKTDIWQDNPLREGQQIECEVEEVLPGNSLGIHVVDTEFRTTVSAKDACGSQFSLGCLPYGQGDRFKAVVSHFDSIARSLKVKHPQKSPWEGDLPEIGEEVKVTVVRLVERGMVVSTESGLMGLLAYEDLQWECMTQDSCFWKEGEQLKAQVKTIYPFNRQVSFSVLSRSLNPWEQNTLRSWDKTYDATVFAHCNNGVWFLVQGWKVLCPYNVARYCLKKDATNEELLNLLPKDSHRTIIITCINAKTRVILAALNGFTRNDLEQLNRTPLFGVDHPRPKVGATVKARVMGTSRDAVFLRYDSWDGFVDREHWQWTYYYSLEGLAQKDDMLDVKVLPSLEGDTQLRFGRKEVLDRPTIRPDIGESFDVRITHVGRHELCVSFGGVEMQIEPGQACWVPEYALAGLDLRKEFKVGQVQKASVIASGDHSADVRLSIRPPKGNPWEYIPLDEDGNYVGTVFSCDDKGFSVKIDFYYGWIPNPGFRLAPGTKVIVHRHSLDRERGLLKLDFVDIAFDGDTVSPEVPSHPGQFPFHIGDDVPLRVRAVHSPEIGSGLNEGLLVESMEEPFPRGVIPLKELAWKEDERDILMYKPGQVIQGRIISMDPVRNVFEASIRDRVPDTRTLEEIQVGEKLDVRILSFKKKNYGMLVQYGDFQGPVRIDSRFWSTLHPEDFFLKDHFLEATVETVDARQGTISFHLPEYVDVSGWEGLSFEPGQCIDTKIEWIRPSCLYVSYEHVLMPLTLDHLSWTKHIQLEKLFFVDEILPVRVLDCSPRSRLVVLDARPILNPFDPEVGFQTGMSVKARVVSMSPAGVYVMAGPTACFLPKEEFPDEIGVLPEFVGNETLQLSVLSVDSEESSVLLTARLGQENPLLRGFEAGIYERFKVTGYDDSEIVLHAGLYPARLSLKDALLGEYPKEDVYRIGTELLLQVICAKGPALKVSASFTSEGDTLPEGVFEAECCLKTPEKGVFLRSQDRFFLLPANTFSQPYEQMALLNGPLLRVRCNGAWQDGLPCVDLETVFQKREWPEDLEGKVLDACCLARFSRWFLLESDGLYLLMDTSDAVSPMKPGAKTKVRVMYLDKNLYRIVVSAVAVKNDPIHGLKIGEFRQGELLNCGGAILFRTFLPGKGFIQGPFLGDRDQCEGTTHIMATPIAIFHDDPSRGIMRQVLFDLSVPRPPRPVIGYRTVCTRIDVDNEHKMVAVRFPFNDKDYLGQIPFGDRFWGGDPAVMPHTFNAVVMRLPNKDGDPYELSAKHTTFNPYFCCEEGEVVKVRVIKPVNGGWIVVYKNAVAYVPDRERSYQIVDIPDRLWGRNSYINAKILTLAPRTQEEKSQFILSAKAAYENPFEGEQSIKCGNVYPATVARTDRKENLVVVRLKSKEIEATITDTSIFISGFNSALPSIGSTIRRVVITEIRYENDLPHVFAKVEKL